MDKYDIRGTQEQIRPEAERIISSCGAEMVEFKLFFSGGRQIVRCLVDQPGGGISIDKCAQINREIFSVIELKGFFPGDFAVEVNSPGIDRLLKTKNDFSRMEGKTVMLWLNGPVEGKSYHEGRITGISDKSLMLFSGGRDMEILFETIKTGKEKIT